MRREYLFMARHQFEDVRTLLARRPRTGRARSGPLLTRASLKDALRDPQIEDRGRQENIIGLDGYIYIYT